MIQKHPWKQIKLTDNYGLGGATQAFLLHFFRGERMFNEQVKIILYANSVKASAEFWQQLGFVLVSLEIVDGSEVAELSVTKTSGTHLVIYDRKFITENATDASEPAPALIFSSDDVFSLYQDLQAKGLPLGDLTKVGEELVFNFVDLDGNYFVVSGN